MKLKFTVNRKYKLLDVFLNEKFEVINTNIADNPLNEDILQPSMPTDTESLKSFFHKNMGGNDEIKDYVEFIKEHGFYNPYHRNLRVDVEENVFFDGVNDIIKKYSSENIKPLSECEKTIEAYIRENKKDNEYRELADLFKLFATCPNNDEIPRGCDVDVNEYFAAREFYSFLKEKCSKNEYAYLLKDGSSVTAKVDLLNPFEKVIFENQTIEMVNPQWHLLVAYYAYIDAAFNHFENKMMSQLTDLSQKKLRILRSFPNKVLKVWMEEAVSAVDMKKCER